MNTPITEAHRATAETIFKLAEKAAHNGDPFREPCAQLIADSEARATAPLRARISSDEELFHEIRMKLTAACGDPYKLHDEALDAIIAERDQLRAEAQQAHITRDATCIKLAGELREARAEVEKAIARAESAEREAFDWKKIARYETARAERAEAEVKRLGHLEAVLRSSAADMTAGNITAGGVADLRAENERLRRAYVRPDDIRVQLESAIARAERAEAELATERARMTTLRNALIAAFEHTGREIKRMRLNESAESGTQWISREIAKALDAAMKEESK